MQPTIIVTAPVPGLIYLNGRLAGEASATQPLIAPVSPCGALYLEYRPLVGDAAPLARKCVFSGGALLADSVAEADGLACVAWPGGAVEVEIAPTRQDAEYFALEGMPCVLARGDGATLELGNARIELPPSALRPTLVRLGGVTALLGQTAEGGQYLATLSPDLSAQTGLLAADRIDVAGGDVLNAIVSVGDSVGHGRLEQWIADGSGLQCVSSEPVWSLGAPRWPQTAEDTMVAAVEAALAAQPDEADGYLTPALAAEAPLRAVGEICDLCLPMKYGAPDPRPCVALLKAENARLATARPLYYRAQESGGVQGPWRIAWMEAGDPPQAARL